MQANFTPIHCVAASKLSLLPCLYVSLLVTSAGYPDERREHPRTSDKRIDSELRPGTVAELSVGALGRASGRARQKQAARRPQFGRWWV
jgi:hypothetical protein